MGVGESCVGVGESRVDVVAFYVFVLEDNLCGCGTIGVDVGQL